MNSKAGINNTVEKDIKNTLCEWEIKKIKDLFTIYAGGDLKEQYYSPQKTKTECFPVFANSLVNKGLYGYTSKPVFPKDSLTITGRGDLGHVEYRNTEFDAIVRLNVLVPKKENEIYVKFFEPLIAQTVKFVNESTGVPQLTAPAIRNKRIFYPKNIKEQIAISGIISKVDQCIENAQKTIDATQKLKKSLMQNLLTGRMKSDGSMRKDEEFYEHPKIGKVPNDWEVKKVSELIKLKNGKANVTSNLVEKPINDYTIPVYGGNGITGYYNKALFDEPKIIVGRVGEYCGNVFITSEKSWVTDNAMYVSNFKISDFDINFLAYKFNSLNFGHYSDSTGQPKITQSGIGAIKVALPLDINEQKQISSIIQVIESKIISKQNKILTIKKLKKSLMQNLLTGKKRVDVDKINSLLESMK